MKPSFEYTTSLQYRLKAATAEVMAFKSGQKYVNMQEEHLKELRFLKRIIKNLREELRISRKETITVRNQWFEIFEELEK